ncbi:hypothetical protein GCM10010505_14530 [Kitasatospora aburaviensis]
MGQEAAGAVAARAGRFGVGLARLGRWGKGEPVIVWVNGAFGSGKRTLVEELRSRWPQELAGEVLSRVGAGSGL